MGGGGGGGASNQNWHPIITIITICIVGDLFALILIHIQNLYNIYICTYSSTLANAYTAIHIYASTESSNVRSLVCILYAKKTCPKNYILICLDVTCIHTNKNSIMRNKRLDNLNFIYRQYVELRVSCVDFKFLERLKFWAAKYKNASNIVNLRRRLV